MREIIYDKKSVDFLKKLPYKIRERIVLKISQAKEDPGRFFERLEGRADYKLRIGDYRIIADITPIRIQVTKIGHRKDVYKKN
jgi:mRNA interferase RelE/StbE